MDFVLLIGIICITFAIILPFRLQLKVENPSCSQEVKAVKANKIQLIIFALIGVALTIIGLCCR